MIRPRDRHAAQRLSHQLAAFHRHSRQLLGLADLAHRESFVAQVIESTRRVRFVSVLRTRDISQRRSEPSNPGYFDPLRAAIVFHRQGQTEEAFWMVFFLVHFGKHKRGGWRYAREVYGALGGPHRWDWATTSADPARFRAWLASHQDALRISGGFGNHRKYQSLDAYSPTGTGAAVQTYVQWVGPPRTHEGLMNQVLQNARGSPRVAFRELYHSMEQIASFGRTARFDYLTMLGKLGLANVEADSPYIQNSTGPIRGARLLFGTPATPAQINQWLVELGSELNLGMQVLEDALCNWQKSPHRFIPFRS